MVTGCICIIFLILTLLSPTFLILYQFLSANPAVFLRFESVFDGIEPDRVVDGAAEVDATLFAPGTDGGMIFADGR